MEMQRVFQAFFSYAHHDARTDPKLIEAFTEELENRVLSKLVNDGFSIWRDKKGLRTGHLWDSAIEQALRSSDVLIILLTPRWITSEYCRKEYTIFRQYEAAASDVQRVAPISARPLENQQEKFTPEQSEIYKSLRERQYFRVSAIDFLRLSEDQRSVLVEEIADDIAGILERCKYISTVAKISTLNNKLSKREFTSEAHNFRDYDFVRSAEVFLDKTGGIPERGIYAQIDFLDRLYVQSEKARIEFSVRRAVVTIDNSGPGKLVTDDSFKGASGRNYSVTLQDAPDALSICINPEPGRRSLAELALQPSIDNYLSQIGTATSDVDVGQIKAELRISLDTEGLQIAGKDSNLSQATRTKIDAVMKIAATKGQQIAEGGQIRRPIPVKERST